MRRLALAAVLAATTGCALFFDDERYSENFARDASVDTHRDVESGGDTSITCPGDRCPATGDTFTCVDRSDDPLNCGTCGNKCADGEYCKAGGCACMPPLVRCNSTSGCIDTGGHHEYCGSCTLRCSATNNLCRATAPLSGYSCTLDSYGCPTGRTLCDGDHCFDTKVDETNCGGCGFKCTSSQVCANGICRAYSQRAGTCAAGETDCPPLPGNTARICVVGTVCPG